MDTLTEAFNPRSTSTGDLMGMQWVDVGNIIESDNAWNQERVYRRDVREQTRRHMALEVRRQWRERDIGIEQERVVVQEGVLEETPQLERDQGPVDAESVEAVHAPSEGVGDVFEPPPSRRRAILIKLKRFVGGELFGRRR